MAAALTRTVAAPLTPAMGTGEPLYDDDELPTPMPLAPVDDSGRGSAGDVPDCPVAGVAVLTGAAAEDDTVPLFAGTVADDDSGAAALEDIAGDCEDD